MFGITNFTAIINEPQTAILAVGGTQLELNSQLVPETRLFFHCINNFYHLFIDLPSLCVMMPEQLMSYMLKDL